MDVRAGMPAWSPDGRGMVGHLVTALLLSAAAARRAGALPIPGLEPLGGPPAVEEADSSAATRACRSPSSPTAGRPMVAPSSSPVVGHSLALNPGSAKLAIARDEGGLTLGVRLVGGDPSAAPEALDRLPARSTTWSASAASGGPGSHLRARRLPPVWPGTDVVWYGDRGRLEYDFRARARRRPGSHRAALRGPGRAPASPPTATWSSDPPPAMVRQRAAGRLPARRRRAGAGRVRATSLHGERTVGAAARRLRPSRPLVIDPLLMIYSTFVGGASNDLGCRASRSTARAPRI